MHNFIIIITVLLCVNIGDNLENNRSCEHNFGNNSKKKEIPESIIRRFWNIIDLSLVQDSLV